MPDPEIPVLNVVEMGIVREVVVEDQRLLIRITPTYMGCPAMDAIADDIRDRLAEPAAEEGLTTDVELVYAPAWTTDWLTDSAQAKLEAYGIAPPGKTSDKRALSGAAPACGAPNDFHPAVYQGDKHPRDRESTELVSLFGSQGIGVQGHTLPLHKVFFAPSPSITSSASDFLLSAAVFQ